MGPVASPRPTLLVIAFGGAIGALCRHLVGELNSGGGDTFPVGTFLANVTGAFGLGLLIAVLDRVRGPQLLRPLIATGFFGVYTTFSTFAVEIVTRLDDGYVATAVTYAIASLVAGLLAATLGYLLGHRVRPAPAVLP